LKKYLPVFFIIILGFLVYANSLHGEFVSDDIPAIVENPFISQPMRYLLGPSHFLNSLNYLIAKHDPFVYHLTNVLLHIINSILVFYFLRLFFDTTASVLGACLFVVHPVHAEAVSWVSGRPYLIITLFIFIPYFFYLSATKTFNSHNELNLKAYLLSLLIFTYFLLGNTSTNLLFPFLLILSDLTFQRWQKTWRLWIPFLAITGLRIITLRGAIVGRVAFVANDFGGPVAWTNPLINFSYSFFSHLALLFWPDKLTLYHEPVHLSSLTFKIDMVILFFLLLGLPFIFKKAKELLFAMGIFILFLAHTYSPFKICPLVAERYLYFPSVFLSIILAFYWERVISKNKEFKGFGLVLLILAISAYALRTLIRNEDWKTPGRFWRATAEVSPDNARARNSLGMVYWREKELQKAVAECSKAVALNPNYAKAYNNLGILYSNMERKEEAVSLYKKSIALDSNCAEPYNNLAILYSDMGKEEEALVLYRKAIGLKRDFVEAYTNLGNLCANTGRNQEAIESYQEAIEINPGYARAHFNLSKAYFRTKAYGLALRHCDRAVELGYKVPEGYLDLLGPYRSERE
jgi:tetratricopeptide (TPR) repeat protein